MKAQYDASYGDAVDLAIKEDALIQGDCFQPCVYLKSIDGKLNILNTGFPNYKKPIEQSNTSLSSQLFRVIEKPEDAVVK